MRTRAVSTSGAAVLLAVGLAGVFSSPAVAAPTDDTVVTLAVDAGTLDITAPVTADLGTGAPGTTVTGSLGSVSVVDERASLDGSWEATVVASDFQTGGGTPAEVVQPSQIDYWSGPAISTTGDGTFTPGQPTAGDAEPLDTVVPVTAFTHAGGTGNNSATWTATLDVNVALNKVAGIYTGTVTHSVA